MIDVDTSYLLTIRTACEAVQDGYAVVGLGMHRRNRLERGDRTYPVEVSPRAYRIEDDERIFRSPTDFIPFTHVDQGRRAYLLAPDRFVLPRAYRIRATSASYDLTTRI